MYFYKISITVVVGPLVVGPLHLLNLLHLKKNEPLLLKVVTQLTSAHVDLALWWDSTDRTHQIEFAFVRIC